jgi:hypothetical protein
MNEELYEILREHPDYKRYLKETKNKMMLYLGIDVVVFVGYIAVMGKNVNFLILLLLAAAAVCLYLYMQKMGKNEPDLIIRGTIEDTVMKETYSKSSNGKQGQRTVTRQYLVKNDEESYWAEGLFWQTKQSNYKVGKSVILFSFGYKRYYFVSDSSMHQ